MRNLHTTSSNTNHWVGVVSRSHVQRGVAGGFIQLNHGKRQPLLRLRAGDWLAMYSPRTAWPDGAPLQAFTALGVVRSGHVYQVKMAPGFHPFRVDVDFLPAQEAPIRPLIDALSFIRDKQHWGAAFRFGQLKVPADDFAHIAAAMGVALPGPVAAPVPAPAMGLLSPLAACPPTPRSTCSPCA